MCLTVSCILELFHLRPAVLTHHGNMCVNIAKIRDMAVITATQTPQTKCICDFGRKNGCCGWLVHVTTALIIVMPHFRAEKYPKCGLSERVKNRWNIENSTIFTMPVRMCATRDSTKDRSVRSQTSYYLVTVAVRCTDCYFVWIDDSQCGMDVFL